MRARPYAVECTYAPKTPRPRRSAPRRHRRGDRMSAFTSAPGTERTWRSGRDMSVIGATADVICSERVFRLLTQLGHGHPKRYFILQALVVFLVEFSTGTFRFYIDHRCLARVASWGPSGWRKAI